MKVDIVVNGRVVGTATVKVEMPDLVRTRHAVTDTAVLNAAIGSQAEAWYCMGEVKLVSKA